MPPPAGCLRQPPGPQLANYLRRTEVSGSQADLLVPLAQRVDRDYPFPVCRRAWRERGLARRGRTRVTCLIREQNYGYSARQAATILLFLFMPFFRAMSSALLSPLHQTSLHLTSKTLPSIVPMHTTRFRHQLRELHIWVHGNDGYVKSNKFSVTFFCSNGLFTFVVTQYPCVAIHIS